MRLPEDDEKYFRDPNAAQLPRHPMEPAILALLTTNPGFINEHTIDVVTCSSVIGSLLDFITGGDKRFRVLVQSINDTVFFIRRENSARELIPNVRGFGHTFPKHNTTWDFETRGSSSHHRVLSYQFGQLGFLVRFNVDGYISDSHGDTMQHWTTTSPSELDSLDTLQKFMQSMQVSPARTTASAGVRIIGTGEPVDQELIFELKTRSFRKKDEDTVETYLPRLWSAQIKQFLLARHDDGVFNEIQLLDVQERVKNWERDRVKALSQLAAIFHQIIAKVHKTPSAKLEIRRVQRNILEVREQLPEAGEALSSSTIALWSSQKSNDKEIIADSDDDDNIEWYSDSIRDLTACSATCGYCGQCIGQGAHAE